MSSTPQTERFTAIWKRAYEAHTYEVTALQNEVQNLCARNKLQEQKIKKFKACIKRMGETIHSARAKLRKAVSIKKRMKMELESHNIPLPRDLCDVSCTSDEEEDSGLHSKFHSDIEHVLLTDYPSESIAANSKDTQKAFDGTLGGEPGIVDQAGKISLQLTNQQRSKVQYQTATEFKEIDGEENSPRDYSNSQIDCCRQSSSPSPSLLNSLKTSKHSALCLDEVNLEEDALHSQKHNLPCKVLQNDSDVSLNMSQNMTESVELTPTVLLHTALQRKRKNSVVNWDDHITSPQKVCKDTSPCHFRSSMTGILPNTPGIKAVSSVVPADKSFFNHVKESQVTTNCNHDIKFMPSDKCGINNSSQLCGFTQRAGSFEKDNIVDSSTCSPLIQVGVMDKINNHNSSSDSLSELQKPFGAQRCRDCRAWYSGIHPEHEHYVCRHEQQQHTDPKMWDISFPNSEECDKLLHT